MAIDNYRRFYAILRQMPQLYSRDEQNGCLYCNTPTAAQTVSGI